MRRSIRRSQALQGRARPGCRIYESIFARKSLFKMRWGAVHTLSPPGADRASHATPRSLTIRALASRARAPRKVNARCPVDTYSDSTKIIERFSEESAARLGRRSPEAGVSVLDRGHMTARSLHSLEGLPTKRYEDGLRSESR